MFHGGVLKVEMYTLHQQVGSHKHLLVSRVRHYGAVVSHAAQCLGILQLNVFREMFDEAELTKFCYFQFSIIYFQISNPSNHLFHYCCHLGLHLVGSLLHLFVADFHGIVKAAKVGDD